MHLVTVSSSSSSYEEPKKDPKHFKSEVERVAARFFETPSSADGTSLLRSYTQGNQKDYPSAFKVSKVLITMLVQKKLKGRGYGTVMNSLTELEKLGSKELSDPFYGWVLFAITFNNEKKGLNRTEKASNYERAISLGCELAKQYLNGTVPKVKPTEALRLYQKAMATSDTHQRIDYLIRAKNIEQSPEICTELQKARVARLEKLEF